MKEEFRFFKMIILVGSSWIFLITFVLISKKEQQERSSRFEQAYQKVQYFDSLSQVYTDQNNLYMMIECRDSMMYYFGEMIKNLKEE